MVHRRSTVAETVIRERAPAKINLDLFVTGRRADGFHELDSLVVFGLVADELWLEPAADFSLSVEGPFAAAVPRGESNLVLQAAREFARTFRPPTAARLRLVKNIPVAAGLGGGSADAAACLRALVRLAGLDPELPVLLDLAAGLGADVPVCVFANTARMRGIGERLDPVRGLPPLPLVLVNPAIALETARVFRALAGRFGTASRPPLPAAPSLVGFASWLARGRNDLEAPARELAPVVGDVLEALRGEEGCLVARMSGSGSSCYGLFSSEAAAQRAAARLAAGHPEWWVAAGVIDASR
ncbi:4-diphosphocytidyl-2-C-methyl-D-erythritol kinase [bacterium HR40]|nr:4-diphosphocytidyl-2-C-methyl-D-erythritol kinase [bacterium HR40]